MSREPRNSRYSRRSSESASPCSMRLGPRFAVILRRFIRVSRKRCSASSSFDVAMTCALSQSTSSILVEDAANSVRSHDIALKKDCDTCSRWIRHSGQSVTFTSLRRPDARAATSPRAISTRYRPRYWMSSNTATKSMSLPRWASPRATDPYSHTSRAPSATSASAARRASSTVGADASATTIGPTLASVRP